MKLNRFCLLTLCCAAVAVLLTACGAGGNFLTRPQTTPQVVTVPAHYTNAVFTPPPHVATNLQVINGVSVPTLVTNQPPIVILTNLFVPERTVTNDAITGYVVNPELLRIIGTGQALNSALNPTPTAPLVNMGLGLLATVASAFAAYKSRKLQNVTTELEPQADALATVVKAVELFQGGDAVKLKEQIQTFAKLDGTEHDLNRVVKGITSK